MIRAMFSPDDLSFALGNPVWLSLTQDHKIHSVGKSLARMYPSTVSNFAAVQDTSAESEEELSEMLNPKKAVYLIGVAPNFVRKDWEILQVSEESQMVFHGEPPKRLPFRVEPLTEKVVPAMLALAHTSVPNAFQQESFKIGMFFGIWVKNELVLSPWLAQEPLPGPLLSFQLFAFIQIGEEKGMQMLLFHT